MGKTINNPKIGTVVRHNGGSGLINKEWVDMMQDEKIKALKRIAKVKKKTKLIDWFEAEIEKKDERIKELEAVLAEIEKD